MSNKLRWGVLSTASIGKKVIPAMQQGQYTRVVAIASRGLAKASQSSPRPLDHQSRRSRQACSLRKAYQPYRCGSQNSPRCSLAYWSQDRRSLHDPQLSPMAPPS